VRRRDGEWEVGVGGERGNGDEAVEGEGWDDDCGGGEEARELVCGVDLGNVDGFDRDAFRRMGSVKEDSGAVGSGWVRSSSSGVGWGLRRTP